ncbi:MAG: hypothetical protein LUH40_05725, partial [Clostridiales bacterium]|nr:hypothetical protein [Clostridiales bacterium]
GLTAGSHCKDCGTVIVAQTVTPVTSHDYVYSETIDGTCQEEGQIVSICSVCQERHVEYTGKDLTNHTNVVTDEAVAATCTTTGLTAGSHCKDCGTVIVAQEKVAAKGHNYVGFVTTEATCGADGVMTYTCSYCGDYYTVAIPATGNHTYGEWEVTKEATNTEEGIETRTCANCGATETRTISIICDHHYVTFEGKAATCTEDGYTDWVECLFCGDIQVASEVIPALGHIDDDGDGYCDRCEEPVETTDDPSGSGSGSDSSSSTSSWDAFRCKMCDTYDEMKDKPVIGWIYAIVHFFVHLAHYISYLT